MFVMLQLTGASSPARLPSQKEWKVIALNIGNALGTRAVAESPNASTHVRDKKAL